MSIKRYTPKYKILSKLRQPVWLDKKGKIKKFTRQKWAGKEKLYFPKKFKVYDQDLSTCVVGNDFDTDRSLRLKGTYKPLLQDKQAFQLYYGARRLRMYQLKIIAQLARQLSKQKKVTSGKAYFHLFENRIEVCMYRLGLVHSLMQARGLLSSGRVKLVDHPLRHSSFSLVVSDLVKIDDLKSVEILARYLRSNHPFFFFRKKALRISSLYKKNKSVSCDILVRRKEEYLQSITNLMSNALSKLKKQ